MSSPFGTPGGGAGGGGMFSGFYGGAGSSTPAFGASSAPGFTGFSAPSAFGGAAAPASPFGAAPPASSTSQSAFSFSTAAASTPAFGFGQPQQQGGAAAGTPSPFGANTTPSPFGGGGLFGGGGGGAAAPSAFGTNLFGTPQQQQSSPAPASFMSAFGAASSASAFGGGFFGASSTAAGGGGTMFGAMTTGQFQQQQQPGGGFGAGGGGFFGGSQMAPAAFNTAAGLQQAGGGFQAAAVADSAAKEISEIKAAYTPGHPLFKFQYLLLNVLDNPAQRVKPPGVDEMRWRQALAAAGGPENPDRLWPVPASGFKDLLARSGAQAGAVAENSERLRSLQDLAHRLMKKQSGELAARAAEVQRRHVELAGRLLHAARVVDALEAKLAAYVGYQGEAARAKEAALSRQLLGVEAELAPSSAGGLLRRLDSVAGAARLRAEGQPLVAGVAQARLDERSSSQLLAVLKDHAQGVAKLQAILDRDALDVAIMRKELSAAGEGGTGGGAQGGARLMIMMD